MLSRLSLALLLTAALPATAFAGPPWISIELPANPWDRDTRGAFLVVHAFHHGIPMTAPISGTAEGLVNGQRRTVSLTLEKTSHAGVFVLRNQWGNTGRWVLVITVDQGEHPGDDVAQAVVEVSEAGAVVGVRVPTRPGADGFPRRATPAEIESTLRSGKAS
jgi:hypothetical protein